MKKKKTKKAKPVKAWGWKRSDGTLAEGAFFSRWGAEEVKSTGEKVVRVEIREI